MLATRGMRTWYNGLPRLTHVDGSARRHSLVKKSTFWIELVAEMMPLDLPMRCTPVDMLARSACKCTGNMRALVINARLPCQGKPHGGCKDGSTDETTPPSTDAWS